MKASVALILFLGLVLAVPCHPAHAQEIQWIRQFGSALYDDASGVAVDATGVYVVGHTTGTLQGQASAGGLDAYVRKYDTIGTELWTRQFGTVSHDEAGGVAVDATGIYVGGETWAALPGQIGAGAEDAFVRKYDANGNELWTRQFGTAFGDGATGVVADNAGVYVVGNTNGHAGSGDSFLRKYDANGNELWTHQFGTLQESEEANDVAVDATGVYIVGTTNGSLPGQISAGAEDAYVRKYDGNGTEQWTRQFGTANFDGAVAVAANAAGVHVVGYSGPAPGQAGDVFLHNYDANGAEQWTQQFGSSSPDFASGVAVHDTAVYIAGFTEGALPGQTLTGSTDAFVAKLIPPPPPPSPAVNDGGVVNHASFDPHPAPVAPGSIAAVFGTTLNNSSTVLFSSFGPDGKLLTSLGSASVTINDIPAPMFYSTPEQLGIQIPLELEGQTSATIQVTVGGQTSSSRTIFLDALAPGIFTLSQDGNGAAAVLHEDGVTSVTEQSPARPGEIVVLFATGLGAATPSLGTGEPSTGNETVSTPTVTIDGIPGEVQFSGTTPGLVGLNQINVRIPPSTRSALDIPVVLSIGGKQSNPVTIAVSP